VDVGIGLPNAVRGVDRRGIVDWAKRAEEAGFSSLGTIDRIVFPNYESLIALAAAAAVTERIRLATDVLLAPLRSNTALLAKQAATLDNLSEGRLALGLAVGGRQDDYEASSVDFGSRGRTFEAQLHELERMWSEDSGVGPSTARGGRPELLIGGGADVVYRRAARYADGWTYGGGPPEAFAEAVAKLNAAWQEAGRDGEPRKVALFYYALGSDPEGQAQTALGDYYAFLGDYAGMIVSSAAKDADTVRARLEAFEQAGADEVICFPTSTDPEQVDLLASAAGLR
jgi:alkanesulfonate monooxygenase SsuD/methylene tetrahydromethanopterin reductase-like flavin-dependent oxidoreductase (luciferase family)